MAAPPVNGETLKPCALGSWKRSRIDLRHDLELKSRLQNHLAKAERQDYAEFAHIRDVQVYRFGGEYLIRRSSSAPNIG